ncbi:MAG: PEGA domain-containing protein [Deltaproteobacteria bacterium]|nr:PEGA domain-containing protein [Deltaproteobacteria bacterium]
MVSLVSVALVGCLPVSKSTRNHDTFVRAFDVETGRSPGEVRVELASAPDRIVLSAESVVTCTRERKKLVKRTRETERTTNHGLHGVVYVLGALAAVTGGALIYDAETSATAEDRRFQVGSEVETGRLVGITTAAAGGLLLLVGITSSVAAMDSEKSLGDVEEPMPGSRTLAECDREPAPNTEIALLMAGAPGQLPPIIALGRTDAGGKLDVAWSDVLAKAPPGARAEGEIVIGSIDALRGDVAIGKQLKGLGRVSGPVIDVEAAWASAVATGTAEAYLAFHVRFPTSSHAAEALDRARAAKARIALAQLDEALVANKLDLAGEALVTLRANGDPATIATAQARLDTARRISQTANAREKLPKLLAALEAAADPVAAFTEAKIMLEAVREVDAAEAARAQVQLDGIRKKVVARLIREGDEAFKRRDFAAGGKQFDAATSITLDVAAVARARTAALATSTKLALSEGRKHVRAKRYEEAIAIADVLLVQAPGNKVVIDERTRWVTARDRVSVAAEAQAAREAAKADAQAAREAAKADAQAAREAAKADKEAAKAGGQESARAAREQQLAAAAERKAREQAERDALQATAAQRLEAQRQQEAAAKAAREAAVQQKIDERRLREEAAKAERDAAQEARRVAIEEKRLAAEAAAAQRRADYVAKKQNAEQERLAKEAEKAYKRAEQEAKRAEDARQRAEELRRKAENARAGIPSGPLPAVGSGIADAPQPPRGGRPTKPDVSGIPPAAPMPLPTMPTSASDIAEARVHFQQGVALYGTGDYAAALVEFEASYRMNRQPFVLKNIGLAQKGLFRYSEAIATFEKYLSSSTKLTPPDPGQTQQLIIDMKALLADVTLTVTPDGAQVSVDGRVVGLTPLPNVLQLATGTHSVEASAEGYEPAKRDIMVSAGVPLTLEMALKRIPTTGKVRITSPIARATVSIDGKPVGTVPIELELESGGHRLEVSAPNHKPHSTELVILVGQEREIGVPLARVVVAKKPWYMNKYVWAGAAAVVVGGVIIGATAGGGTEAPIDGTLGGGSSGVP